MDRKQRVAVVGAGLGGLCAAGFLQRAGFAVRVFEQAPAFSRIGAGIILSANATKVLRRLGLEDALIAAGIKSRQYISRAWDSGETMYEIVFDAASERRHGGPYVHIHRGDLHTVLERAVAPGTIAFDHQLVELDERADAVRLIFANGASAEADIVIGADGIRSKVRDFLLGAEPPRFSGAAAYRAIFPADRLKGLRIPDCTKWWGTDRHCLPYYLTGRRDEVYAIGVVPVLHWDGDEASVPTTREQYLASFAHFHADLQRVLQAVRQRQPVADLRSGAQRLLERRPGQPHRAVGRRLSSGAALYGRWRRHGGGGRRDLKPLPDRIRQPRGSVRVVHGDTNTAGRRRATHLAGKQLDARADRHRLVLLLRSVHRAA